MSEDYYHGTFVCKFSRDMELNYWWLGLAALAVVILITWLVRRNMRDKRKFERNFLQSDIKPEKHGAEENDGV